MLIVLEKIKRIQFDQKINMHNVFAEEIREIALSSNDDKRMQSIDSMETYSYGTGYILYGKKKILNKEYIKILQRCLTSVTIKREDI